MYLNKHIPNILTISRIIVIPIIVITFFFDDVVFAHRLAAGLFFYASATDFLDGYLARKYNLQSNFGRMLDPISDKLLVSCIILMLARFEKVEILPCLLILSREILVSGLREFLSDIRVSVPVDKLAKIKTTVQMLALMTLLLGSKGSGIVYCDLLGKILLWLAAILTIITGFSYIRASTKYLW